MIKKHGLVQITEKEIWVTHFHYEGPPEQFLPEVLNHAQKQIATELEKLYKQRSQQHAAAQSATSSTPRTSTKSATPNPSNRKSKKRRAANNVRG